MIQKLFSEKKTKRKLLIFGLIFIAVVGSVSGWVFKSYFKSNIERPVINIYTTSSHGYDNSIMYDRDIIINPLPLELDNKSIQLNLQKKVNDFLVEHYKNVALSYTEVYDNLPVILNTPKLSIQDLEREVAEELDYYGNILTGKVFTSDGEYDYEVSTNNRFANNRYSRLLENKNKTFNFEVSKVLKDSDNARMYGESEPSLKNTQNIISHQINNSNFNYYRNFSQNSNLNLCDVYNGESLPLCRAKSSYTNIIVDCNYDEKSFFSCHKTQSNVTELSQDNLNKSHLKYVYYRNAFLNFNTVNKLYAIEPAIENIKIPSFQEFIDSNNLTSEFENIIKFEYLLQWQSFDFKQCVNQGNEECNSNKSIVSRLMSKLFLLFPCESCGDSHVVKDSKEAYRYSSILKVLSKKLQVNNSDAYREYNFSTLINADFSYEKFKKLKLLEYEQEYNKVKEYFVVLNDLIKETQWIFSDISDQRYEYETSIYVSYVKNKLIDFGLDKIDLSNVDVLSDADKISLVNRMLLTNLNKGCSTISYSQVDSSCDYYKNYILANEPELTKEYFYNLSLRHRFIRLYEIILMHQPSFYIDDEFYVRLKYLKRVNSALTLNVKSYNEYNNSDTKIDFGTVKNINFVEIATSKDQILTRKLRIPLFDGYTFYCEDEKNPSSCISGYYDFNGRSKEFIDNVIAQKKEIENDPLLKSIYDRENNEKLKSLLDFYLGIVVLPFLVNE